MLTAYMPKARRAVDGPLAWCDKEANRQVNDLVAAVAQDDVLRRCACVAGDGLGQRPVVGIEAIALEAGQRPGEPGRRPVGILVGVQAHEGIGRQAGTVGQCLPVGRLVRFQLPHVG